MSLPPFKASKRASAILGKGRSLFDPKFVWAGISVSPVSPSLLRVFLRAAALFLGDHQLGYLPRTQNETAAKLLNREEQIEASTTGLTLSDDP